MSKITFNQIKIILTQQSTLILHLHSLDILKMVPLVSVLIFPKQFSKNIWDWVKQLRTVKKQPLNILHHNVKTCQCSVSDISQNWKSLQSPHCTQLYYLTKQKQQQRNNKLALEVSSETFPILYNLPLKIQKSKYITVSVVLSTLIIKLNTSFCHLINHLIWVYFS